MQPHPSFNPRIYGYSALRRTGHEIAALGAGLVGYLGILVLLVVAAVTLWDGLPDTVVQARQVAVMAGWMIDPPPLRGSL